MVPVRMIAGPEGGQPCVRSSGEHWRCGQQGSLALSDRIGRATIRCEPRDIDRYHRVVAVCFKGSEDLNRWMVANGWAVAFRRYSRNYAADEDAARKRRSTSGLEISTCHGTGGRSTKAGDEQQLS